MAEITIDDASLSSLRNEVVVITGGGSGIGLATTLLLLGLGAHVVVGDLCKNDETFPNEAAFVQTDVCDWTQLVRLFKTATEQFGHVDHVFANAGIAARGGDALTELDVDETGEPKQPDHSVMLVNFVAVMDTAKLAIHYLRRNTPGGSIVLTASSSSYQRFGTIDYTASKHGVLGIMRGLHAKLTPKIPIRLNCICPSWTESGIIDSEIASRAGIRYQSPHHVARSVAMLMADRTRSSQLIYSCQGMFTEFEQDLLAATDEILRKAASIDPRTRTEQDELIAYSKAAAELGKP